jgi:hypothetical protein
LTKPRTSRRYIFEAALIVTVAFGSFAATAHTAIAPRNAQDGIAVLFAPWTDARDAFVRSVEAGGRFVRYGAYPFIAVVMPDDPDYAARVRANGAWLLADPQALAACFP